MLDGFLELLNGGKSAIEGETTDVTFGKKNAMAITDFELSSSGTDSKKKKGEEDDGDEEEPPPAFGSAGSLLAGWNNLGAAAAGAKKRKFSLTFEVSKDIDVAGPELFLAYCQNATDSSRVFDQAKVTLRKASGKNALVYLVFTFTDVRVATYELESQKEKTPREKLTFSFKACTMQYRPQKNPGLASAKVTGWDFDASEETGG